MSLALPSLANPVSPASAPPGLAEQLLSLRRRWRLIAAATLLVPALTLIALLVLPPRYTATGILLYDPGNAVIPGDSATPQDVQNQDEITASQGAVIASLPAARTLAANLNLAQVPEYSQHRFWQPTPAKPPSAADIAAQVLRNLTVTVLPGSRVLSVSFTSSNPALAATAANLAMQLYLDHERDQSFASLTDAQSWLETHAATVQSQLDATEAALAQARAAAGVVQGTQATLTAETASGIAASLVQAQAELAMNQARLSSASSDAAANAAIAPNLLPLRKEQADLSAQVQALSQSYGPDYPDLQTARTQLAAITAEINAETARELDAARAEVAADQAEVATLQGALANARTQSQAEDAQSAPIRALEQRAQASRDMLRSMTEQAGQLAQDASLTRPDARILSAAAQPSAPSTPRHGLILGLATALGFCFGVLLAGLLDALDTSLRSGEDVRALTGLPCLALLPTTSEPERAALNAPFSLFTEQLRALHTGLALGSGGSKIIAITAARPGEGKTTATIALARSLATSGLRVLAIDGDIRQPGFNPIFATTGKRGLTDYLHRLATLEEILLTDPLSPLQIIPAGTPSRAALSLFLSPALPACLATLRPRFDVILLDVPPAFALAEGRVLASLADSALLCIRWGHTPRRVVLAAMLLLRESGVTLAGAALTRVNAKAHGNSGYADAEIYQPRYSGYFKG